ncbi:GNAT family N-acetyltransferase [Paenibacillus planticolens]|uniref:GNAT family N-acetyltransferase n=1 Tax=Paenibacillus planticolens TaxID=2654976 RepID=A0ABX1ZMI2_9BACL|nr:GNAT family N-acetyltransferase [Paenibacillus planticolens]NOV01161.1 GNAT family N-acetyltransferase [Paenibacillus planticolens]
MEIIQLIKKDGKSLLSLYRTVSADLNRRGVHQWDWFYPNRFVIQSDVKRGTAFGIRDGEKLIGAVVVDAIQSSRYAGLPWIHQEAGQARCIHRLAVDPAYQGQGLGKKLLQFAEEQARGAGGASIRLDVFSGNPGAAQLYVRAGYRQIGTIRFPMRSEPYYCFEKLLSRSSHDLNV